MTEDWRRAQYDERVLISIVSVHGRITLNSERPIQLQTNTSSRLHLIYNYYTWLNGLMVTLTEFILLIKFIRLHGFGGTHYVINNTNVTIKCTENYKMIGCYLKHQDPGSRFDLKRRNKISLYIISYFSNIHYRRVFRKVIDMWISRTHYTTWAFVSEPPPPRPELYEYIQWPEQYTKTHKTGSDRTKDEIIIKTNADRIDDNITWGVRYLRARCAALTQSTVWNSGTSGL